MSENTVSEKSLLDEAKGVWPKAYAPYSGFRVGAAIRSPSGRVHLGVNVENAAYPEGTCAEAGAIAAMIAAGDTEIAEIAVVGDAPDPVTPCGGCRQKIAEFARKGTKVTMGTLDGGEMVVTIEDLIPWAFAKAQMEGK
ncbi:MULTISPECIES: cytidine deaminase [Maritimibacter]|uniref:Cytidine deaminase n=1 Tax=Maritimibacter alkaliphilus HTCC2654 TaxID=314271 RepID=A3VAX5_9RHOB|nr:MULTISPECIES: cytidine deaminase [Maritimibacter]EAQ15066.1 Cytidine deaminase [Maritimibacter alkaliphilus HTCC2654]TYP80711.1 cytidine deaminase [Maritimibacter alkaliphilus HTCC2654]